MPYRLGSSDRWRWRSDAGRTGNERALVGAAVARTGGSRFGAVSHASTLPVFPKEWIWTAYEVRKNLGWSQAGRAKPAGRAEPGGQNRLSRSFARGPLRHPHAPSAAKVGLVSDRSRKLAKPAAAFGLLATMASIWWFALRPRRKIKLDE